MPRKKKEPKPIEGTLTVHPRGFGFLSPDDREEHPQDFFIPKPYMGSAADGDRVTVSIDEGGKKGKGPVGRVEEVLTRARTHIAGVVDGVKSDKIASVFVPLFGKEKPLFLRDKKKHGLRVGDRVVVKITEWGDKFDGTYGTLQKVLGHIEDPSTDVPAAILEYELRHKFPKKVVEQAQKHGSKVSTKEANKRVDYRDIETVTIDPETAKDFDDAISLRKEKSGHYHLAVHIADVSFYVPAGSALDREAALRCNSTYFPGRCVPMLPHELSDQLCSLRPNVDRLAITVEIELDGMGTVVGQNIVRSVIKSDKRFSYGDAAEILKGKRSKHGKLLRLMEELCHVLKKQRAKRGSIEFALPEGIVKVEEDGTPTGMHFEEYDITHQMVEEFMLKANEVVAMHLDKEGKELPYRIHDSPPPEDLKDFALLVRNCGFKMSDEPTVAELQDLFYQVADTEYSQLLAVAYIRCQQLAIYSPDNIGHHGLCLEHYCHFTSPIRRYVDLVIHRTLFTKGLTVEELQKISDNSTEQERLSARAEDRVKTLKKLRLLLANDEKDPHMRYDAVVTSVKPFGLFFEVTPYLVEGFVHISELGRDYFVHNEERHLLYGERSGKTFSYGKKISVRLSDGNLITGETKWALA